jgi:hypothetical protein
MTFAERDSKQATVGRAPGFCSSLSPCPVLPKPTSPTRTAGTVQNGSIRFESASFAGVAHAELVQSATDVGDCRDRESVAHGGAPPLYPRGQPGRTQCPAKPIRARTRPRRWPIGVLGGRGKTLRHSPPLLGTEASPVSRHVLLPHHPLHNTHSHVSAERGASVSQPIG